jgi:3-oxoacyl-[acyl-carrier protein] reductase
MAKFAIWAALAAFVEDVANVAEFFASDLSAFVSGQHLLISGGAPS